MIEKIKNGLKKRKVKVFLVFLLCSTLAWFVSKLSETYTSTAVFDLEYVDSSDDRMLIHASHDKINIKLEALGFQFLAFSFGNKKVQIDLSATRKKAEEFFIAEKDYSDQIEKQLYSSMKLLEIESDTLFFDFQDIITKRVLVKPRIKLNLAQNYLLDGALIINPDTITIKGTKDEIDTIDQVLTTPIDLTRLTSDFSKKASIIKSEELKNTTFSSNSVRISGKVSKFSEKILKVAVKVIYLPENTTLTMFPDVVNVLCKGSLDALKKLKPSDIEVIVDYRKRSNSSKKLPVVLRKKPMELYSAILQETEVEYILKHN